jgi:hypothetical protein
MGALETLLGMQSDTNLSGDDCYMKRRRASILSGEEDMAPDADSAETRATQFLLGKKGLGVSRESIQNDELAKVRQAIGMEQMKHQALMDRERQKGQFELAAADRQSEALANKMLLQNFLMMGREGTRADRQDLRQDDAQEAAAALKSQTASTGVPTGDMVTRLSKSRQAYQGGPWNAIKSAFGMERSGKQDYESALTDVLTRQGTLGGLQAAIKEAAAVGMSGSQAIAEAEAQGAQLSPYEVEYIKLALGE